MIKKIKKISKYILNALNMINALIIEITPIWGFKTDKITDTIVVVTAVISAYLIGGKLFITKGEE